MADVQVNSRLTSVPLSATAVPSTRDFVALRDARDRPMIIYIGSDDILRLVIEDGQLHRRLLDLNEALGFSQDEFAKAFDAKQDVDGTTYFAAAVCTKNNSISSRLVLLKPFKPQDIDLFAKDSLRNLAISSSTPQPSVVHKISIGEKDSLAPYPLVVISFQKAEQITSQQDISRISVRPDFSAFSIERDLRLPTNVSRIVDVCPATVAGTRGIFVLYDTLAGRHILFTAYSSSMDVSVKCPKVANRLAVFADSQGKHNLVIAGNGFTLVHWKKLGRSNAEGTQFADTEGFINIKDIDISVAALDSDVGTGMGALSIWATTADNSISYISFRNANQLESPDVIRLVPEDQGGYFSTLTGRRGHQSIVYSNESGDLTYLEQAGETDIWNPQSLLIYDEGGSKEITCFLCEVTVRNTSTGQPLANAHVDVTSSAHANIYIDDRPYYITSTGTTLQTDLEGKLCMVIPTEDISSPTFVLNRVSDPTRAGKSLPLQPPEGILIDPAKFTMDQFSRLSTADELKKATSLSGKPLFEKSQISDEDFNKAATAMKTLQEQKQKLDNDSSNKKELRFSGSVKATQSAATVTPWSFFRFLETTAKKIGGWVVEKLEQGWAFTVQIAGKAWNFILDTVDSVKKAMSWVWENLLKEPLLTVIRWAGFHLVEFASDIMSTKRLLHGMIDATLDCGTQRADQLAEFLESKIADFKKSVEEISHKRSSEMESQTMNDRKRASQEQQKEPTVMDSVQAWIRRQLKEMGSKAKRRVTKVDGSNKDDFRKQAAETGLSSIIGIWDDLLVPFMEEIAVMLLKVTEDFLSMFESGSEMILVDLQNKIAGDLLSGIVGSLGSILTGLIRIIGRLVQDIKTVANMPLDEIFIGPIYRYFGVSGMFPSLLDIICFIIAIPAAVIRKITGAAEPKDKNKFRSLPPKITAANMEASLKGELKSQDPKLSKQMENFEMDIAMSLVTVGSMIDVGRVGYAFFTAGSGLAGPPKLKKASGFVGALVKLLIAVLAWPKDQNVPGRTARQILSIANGLNAACDYIIGAHVTVPGRLKVAAGIDAGVAILTLALCPVIYGAELGDQTWLKHDHSMTWSAMLATGTNCVGKVFTNGAILSVEPVTVTACAATGQLFSKVLAGSFKMANYTESLEKNAWKDPE